MLFYGGELKKLPEILIRNESHDSDFRVCLSNLLIVVETIILLRCTYYNHYYQMKRILVCDDDLDILEILDYALTDSGWEVVTSFNVDNIIDKVESARPSVIIMDNWIPGVGGIEATQTIKNHPVFKNIPVIYSTANNDIEILVKKAGADLSLAKPFDLDALTNVVETAYLLKTA